MGKITQFEDLNCWKLSRTLVKDIYRISNTGYFKKDFGLRDQIQRASVSIMTNIAEGFARYNTNDSIRFLNFSQSSASEVRSLLYVAEDLNYITKEEAEDLRNRANECKKMILALIKHMKSRPK